MHLFYLLWVRYYAKHWACRGEQEAMLQVRIASHEVPETSTNVTEFLRPKLPVLPTGG